MKKFFGIVCAFSIFLSVPGCGGSDEPTSVVEDAGQTELEEYEAAMVAEEAAMDADPPADQ